MPIGFRAATGANSQAASTDVALTQPGAVQPGDALLAFAYRSGTDATAATPAGWAVAAGPVDKGTILRAYVFVRIADPADAGSTLTVSWSVSAATRRNLQLAAYSGADPAAPIADIASFVETAAGTSHSAPAATAPRAGCWVVEGCADRGSPGSTDLTAPAGFTERDQQITTGGGGITSSVADEGPVAVGPQGGDSWAGTLSTANAILWTVVLAPAAAAPVPAHPIRRLLPYLVR